MAFDDATLVPMEDTAQVTKAWELVPGDEWRQITLPSALLKAGISSVRLIAGRFVVVGSRPSAEPGFMSTVVLSGPSLEQLTVEPASDDLAHPPARIEPPPPPDAAITVTGSPDSIAFGPSGLVATGFVSAGFDTHLLPESIQKLIRQHDGWIDIKDGHVIVWDGTTTFFDQDAATLGLTPEDMTYLAQPGEARMRYALWTAPIGGRLQQSPAVGLPTFNKYGNLRVSAVSNGFVVTPAQTTNPLWWSANGTAWQALTSPGDSSYTDRAVVELGDHWIVHTHDGVAMSTDRGQNWRQVLFSDLLPAIPNGVLFPFDGTPTFGLIGIPTPFSVSTMTPSAAALLYSPDGDQWTSRPLDDAVGFAVAVPRLAVNDGAAIIAAQDRSQPPGPDNPTRLVLITR